MVAWRIGMAVLLCAYVMAGAETAHAQERAASDRDRETAPKLLSEGDQAMERQDFAAALKAYQSANAIMHLPTTALEVARSEAASGKLLEARATCHEIEEMPPFRHERKTSLEAREAASQLDAQLEARIPTVMVEPTNLKPGDTFSLIIDDRPISVAEASRPQPLDPGEHSLRIITRRFPTVTVRVQVVESQALSVPVAIETQRSKPEPNLDDLENMPDYLSYQSPRPRGSNLPPILWLLSGALRLAGRHGYHMHHHR